MEAVGCIRACWHALVGKKTSYYPRNTAGQALDPGEVFSFVNSVILNPGAVDLAPHVELAKSSLEEVKELTSYQDQKISRLLTIVAFLTAAAGVVMSKFISLYPPFETFDRHLKCIELFFIGGVYVLFALFLLLVGMGALVAFHAARTRFVWKDPALASARQPKSYLFFRGIIQSTPEHWAKSFSDSSGNAIVPEDELRLRYLRNYVAETYLVAAKVGDKVRYLEPAQTLLSSAIRLLLLLLVFIIISSALVRPVAAEPFLKNQVGSTRHESLSISFDSSSKGTEQMNSVKGMSVLPSHSKDDPKKLHLGKHISGERGDRVRCFQGKSDG